MKITAKQYSEALYESVQGKNKNEVKKAVEEFASVLRANNDLGQKDKIIARFTKLYNQKEGIVEAEVSSASELGSGTKKTLKDYIKKISQAEKVEVKEIEDKSIIGGTVIKYGDKILDASLRTRIRALRSELKK